MILQAQVNKDKYIKRRGLMLILSGPSGAGKTTLERHILAADSHIHLSISTTTRPMRPGEQEGVHYHFVDVERFYRMIQDNAFLEYAEILGNLYGTPRIAVEKHLCAGEDVIFVINWQGHRQLMGTAREDVASVFILPPSKEDLLRRIVLRNQDSIDAIKKRLELANLDISHWHEYDYIIRNSNIETSLKKLLAILHSERLKKARRTGLANFIQHLLQQDVSHLL